MMDDQDGGDSPTPETKEGVVETGNLTVGELTAQLKARHAEPKEESKEEPPAEELPPETDDAETAEEVVANDPMVVEPEEEETQPESEDDTKDVLSKFNIDLDSLSAEEAETLAKALGSRAVKRFARLTGQKKELQERMTALEQHYSEIIKEKDEAAETAGATGGSQVSGELESINTEEKLQDKVGRLNYFLDWVNDQMVNEPDFDEDGNEYIAEVDGQKYTKQELKDARENARKELHYGVPERRKYIEERKVYDEEATKAFDWLSNEEGEKYKFYQESRAHPRFDVMTNNQPDASYLLGLLVEGYFTVKGRQNGVGGKAIKATPPAPATASAAPRRETGNADSNLEKRIIQAEGRFAKSGSQNDLSALRKLQSKQRAEATT